MDFRSIRFAGQTNLLIFMAGPLFHLRLKIDTFASRCTVNKVTSSMGWHLFYSAPENLYIRIAKYCIVNKFTSIMGGPFFIGV